MDIRKYHRKDFFFDEIEKENVGGQSSWRCNHCGAYFIELSSAIQHLKLIHPTITEPKDFNPSRRDN